MNLEAIWTKATFIKYVKIAMLKKNWIAQKIIKKPVKSVQKNNYTKKNFNVNVVK